MYVCMYMYVHVGLIGQLEVSTFALLSKLQEKMAAAITSVGNIEHEVYPPFEIFVKQYNDLTEVQCTCNSKYSTP